MIICDVVTFQTCPFDKSPTVNCICESLTKSCENYELLCQIYRLNIELERGF